MKNMKTINMHSEECSLDMKFDEFMEFWQAKMDVVPSEFINTAAISIETDYGSGSMDICVSYERIETDEEEQGRELRVKQNDERVKSRNMSEYFFLKNKLGL